MSGTPTVYPLRVVTIEERVSLTHLKMQKPQYAPYLAAIQSVMNQNIVPYAFFGMAHTRGMLDPSLLDAYTNSAESRINNVLTSLGVTFDLAAVPITGGIRVHFGATKGPNSAGSFGEINGEGPDFGPVYGQSKDIAVARWASYPELLSETDVRLILGLATEGYGRFVLGDNPTPRQQLAAIKHRLKITAVDPTQYIERLRGAVEKYGIGYELGVEKYSYVIRWVGQALRVATQAAKIVFDVL
jgi:hypothetical protein